MMIQTNKITENKTDEGPQHQKTKSCFLLVGINRNVNEVRKELASQFKNPIKSVNNIAEFDTLSFGNVRGIFFVSPIIGLTSSVRLFIHRYKRSNTNIFVISKKGVSDVRAKHLYKSGVDSIINLRTEKPLLREIILSTEELSAKTTNHKLSLYEQRVTDGISTRLHATSYLFKKLNIIWQKGTAFMMGKLKNQNEFMKAKQIIDASPAVQNTDISGITIEEDQISDKTISDRIYNTFRYDSRFNIESIIHVVHNRRVTLSGFIETKKLSKELTAEIAKIEGVKSVDNFLQTSLQRTQRSIQNAKKIEEVTKRLFKDNRVVASVVNHTAIVRGQNKAEVSKESVEKIVKSVGAITEVYFKNNLLTHKTVAS